jgi:hypothetical protein
MGTGIGQIDDEIDAVVLYQLLDTEGRDPVAFGFSRRSIGILVGAGLHFEDLEGAGHPAQIDIADKPAADDPNVDHTHTELTASSLIGRA